MYEGRRKKIAEDFLINLIFLGTLFAILGGRVYYVIFNWGYYSRHLMEMFEIWNDLDYKKRNEFDKKRKATAKKRWQNIV